MQDRQAPDVLGLEAEAYQQSGYFNAAQARAHAVSRQLLEHHIRRGRFQRVRRGLYRIQGFPTVEHDDMREAWMTVGIPDALLSHESALALLDLSDNIPGATHILVPRRHRGLRCYRAEAGSVWLLGRSIDREAARGASLRIRAPGRTAIQLQHGLLSSIGADRGRGRGQQVVCCPGPGCVGYRDQGHR
jgi:hypothetical protein